jgi:peptidoglycan/xylan/chitin deacetylase (PgdA/CDA1 family)
MKIKPGHIVFLFFLLDCCKYAEKQAFAQKPCETFQCFQGGVIRADTTGKELAIVFTGGDYADGGEHIRKVLKTQDARASFFFTGDFYRNPDFRSIISDLKDDGHYLGAHSDKHLLYCDWTKRDSLLLSKDGFLDDLEANYDEIAEFGIEKEEAKYFMPPFEWYNDTISQWTKDAGFQLINFTPGTRSNADYTTPDMPSYRSSEEIFQSIVHYERSSTWGLNGFILLIHIGTAPKRTDKFYDRLEELILWLKGDGYELKRIDELLGSQ